MREVDMLRGEIAEWQRKYEQATMTIERQRDELQVLILRVAALEEQLESGAGRLISPSGFLGQ